MAKFNYAASFSNSTSRLNEVVRNLRTVAPQEIAAEMVAIANCATLKSVEGKTIALALIIAKWVESGEDNSVLAHYDFSKVEAKDLEEKKCGQLISCATSAYNVRQWATVSVKVKA